MSKQIRCDHFQEFEMFLLMMIVQKSTKDELQCLLTL